MYSNSYLDSNIRISLNLDTVNSTQSKECKLSDKPSVQVAADIQDNVSIVWIITLQLFEAMPRVILA